MRTAKREICVALCMMTAQNSYLDIPTFYKLHDPPSQSISLINPPSTPSNIMAQPIQVYISLVDGIIVILLCLEQRSSIHIRVQQFFPCATKARYWQDADVQYSACLGRQSVLDVGTVPFDLVEGFNSPWREVWIALWEDIWGEAGDGSWA
jgi:hypothetical protein